jgi:WD40 repeat protein
MNHQKIKVYFFTCLLCIMLGACMNSTTTLSPTISPPTSENPSVETQTSKIIPETPMPSFATATFAIQSSPTLKSTSILSTTPTIRPTSSFTITTNPQSAQTKQAHERFQTQIANFTETCNGIIQNEVSLSPNGNWLAISCGYDHDQTLKIVSLDGRQWILNYKDYLPEEDREFLPIGALYPRYWVGEYYLYFVVSIGYSGGGSCRFYPAGGEGLYRIDLITGAVSTTLPPLHGASSYNIAFSPDGTKLAYNRTDRPTILDLITGDVTFINTEVGSFGDFTWSPDGSELAYATCEIKDVTGEVKKGSIKIYSLATHTLKTILEIEGNTLHLFGNIDMVMKIANDETYDYSKATRWYYDWTSEQIVIGTPNP